MGTFVVKCYGRDILTVNCYIMTKGLLKNYSKNTKIMAIGVLINSLTPLIRTHRCPLIRVLMNDVLYLRKTAVNYHI